MNLQDLKRILISFADNAADVEINKGKISAFIRGEFLEALVIEKDSELYIVEDNVERKAIQWIALRLAQLEQLSDRIREYIASLKDFVTPSGKLLEDIDTDPSEIEKDISDTCGAIQKILNKKIPGTTGVTYLTSDAGEGKTTIINQVSILQANLFKKKETTWLLVPIPLGGRPFLRFDDIVIASLVNRLRFRAFYYESFIELVKLGLIVPAFDGFEEMLVESSSGEALSATGHLMAKLGSSGNVLIAARKAYFDYINFSSQAKLFDTIGANSVAFSQLTINRWDKSKFIEYTNIRNIRDGEEIYQFVSKKLGDNHHPLLTRPVLVSRLLEVVSSTQDIERLSETLENPSQYFFNFVEAIIIREAETKWIDVSGEPYKPLLTTQQHHELLTIIAEEMWLNSTDSLSLDVIDLLCDLYNESKAFPPKISSQIKDRIKQHALLTISDQNPGHLKFDHEEFMFFYVGLALYRSIQFKKSSDFKYILRKGTVHKQIIDSFITSASKGSVSTDSIVDILNTTQINESPTSFVKENCGTLILKILSIFQHEGKKLENYSFPSGWLSNANLQNLVIINSNFQATGTDSGVVENCIFQNCTFAGIEISNDKPSITKSILRDCEVLFVRDSHSDLSFYDPKNIESALKKAGFDVTSTKTFLTKDIQQLEPDKDLEIVERALRRFIRGSHINDNVFRIRLGNSATYFLETLLPILLKEQILIEIDWVGGGQKRRFKLGIPFEKISEALQNARGSFAYFLDLIKNTRA